MITRERPISILVDRRCRLLGLSQRTVGSYAARLVHFEDWLGSSAMTATQEQAAAWLARSAERRASADTLRHDRCALVFLFRHMHGIDPDIRLLPYPRRAQRRLRQVADPWEVATVLGAVRDPLLRLFCRFLYATGMRLREAEQVRFADLDLTDRSIVVRCAKGGSQRRTILPDGLLALLYAFRWPWPSDAAVFARRDGDVDGSWAADCANSALLQARRRTGLGRHLTAHSLRHCFATHLHERGVGLGELQRLLGHSSVQTTMLYIGMREARRREIAEIGDLLADLPEPGVVQQRISFVE